MKLDRSFCFMFLALTEALNPPFSRDNESNISTKFCATNLRTRAKRKQKIVHCYGQFSIDCDNIFLAFEGFKFS